MGEQTDGKLKKHICAGLLAHVDAGKTTLSEALLYCAGAIRTLGRVDHGDTFLDTFQLERQRGITIFSKQAVIQTPNAQITLLDTPGHVDFSAEMERTLSVLDCAVLVISGPAGVQSHTKTVWKLLRERRIPTLLFVGKMDLPAPDRGEILQQLHKELSPDIFDLEHPDPETLATGNEAMLESFLEHGTVSEEQITQAVQEGKLFPCCFGAALKLEGVEEFLRALERFAPHTAGGPEFGARVYKISRDDQGVRMTHMKITGGVLRVRENLSGPDWTEKVTAIRMYSGTKFRALEEAVPGDVVAVTGLTRTGPGQGLGTEAEDSGAQLQPVLTYRVLLPDGTDPHIALGWFRQLEEEDPQLYVDWNERLQELRVQLMGPIQREILQELVADRFGLRVDFGPGSILYRETIAAPVEGVGHYEPLRHYAEVHLLLEPGERGSGIRIATNCSEDSLGRNWQRLILTHLQEKQHLGVLTGSPITDISLTLVSGRASIKHTEGGDFRQATYRAVRHGLMRAQNILLEPWYDFIIELPQNAVGRAMTDLERMGARFSSPDLQGDTAVLSGCGPVAKLQDYPAEITAYTKGLGRYSCTLRGYEPCPEQDEIVTAINYDPQADLDNSPDSIFCAHGAGILVPWYEVEEHMHLPSWLEPEPEEDEEATPAARYIRMAATDEELRKIFERTYGPINRDPRLAMEPAKRRNSAPKPYKGKPQPTGPEYLLVDGYNIIFAWEELKELAKSSLEIARDRLIEILRNYQGYKQCPVILVFDAYKVRGGTENVERHGGVSVVYTKEAETADMYIERTTRDLSRQHRVRVATSDALEQVIILGGGALRVSAAEFEHEVRTAEREVRDFLKQSQLLQ